MKIADLLWMKMYRGVGDPSNRQTGGLPHMVTFLSRTQQRAQRAFTMIEIAIALAIIGFALLTIVGLLPMGLTVQKDNREDTIISQDGNYFIEAIRGGVVGLDNLTNYVDRIIISNSPSMGQQVYTSFADGKAIVQLLSTNKYVTNSSGRITNEVIAYVRAFSGSALMQSAIPNDPQDKLMSFYYQLRSEVTRFNSWDPKSTNLQYLTNNLFDVRLRLAWPVLRNGTSMTVGEKSKYQVFRTLISATQNTNGVFEPQTYHFQ